MRLTFVGTSHGIPQKDRFCSCYMIESGNGVYFVDAGTSFSDAMRDYGVDASGLRAVFTTHPHSDHTGGIVAGISTLAWRMPDLKFKIFFTTQEMIDAYRQYLAATFYCPNGEDPAPNVDFCLAWCSEVFRDENVSVTYHPTAHLKNVGLPSYGILVKELSTGASVLFSGDLSYELRENDYPAEAAEPHDLFVCEMAHFFPRHIEGYLATSAVKSLAITHLWPAKEKLPLIRDMATRLAYPVWIAKDGDVVSIERGEVKLL
ncbi:MAG: ribonuclease Z [Clostridia bacterium]|nr:ribonuclease Z [Clostridia bacterium]MBQ9807156.1 ribonuclease Z [Clostridia bacterium]